MLVLTRKSDERIMIGHDIVITVIDTITGTVRLGISAPKSVAVHRHEIHERIRRERRWGEPPTH